MKLGITLSPITSLKFEVLVDQTHLPAGVPLINQLIKIPYIRNEQKGWLIGKVVSFRVENKPAEYADSAKYFGYYKNKESVKKLIDSKTNLIAECQVVTALSTDYKRLPIDTSIEPMQEVYFLQENDLQILYTQLKENVFQLGYYWGTQIPFGIYLRDFSSLNEAYHYVVAGQTGSGKSTLVKMLLAGYAKVSQNMNILVLDPVGEFSLAFEDKDNSFFTLPMKTLWAKINRKLPKVISLSDMAFDQWELLEELLASKEIFVHLGIKRNTEQESAAHCLIYRLRRRGIKLGELYQTIESKPNLLQDIMTAPPHIAEEVYVGKEEQKRVRNSLDDPILYQKFYEKFLEIAQLFDTLSGKKTIKNVIWSFMKGAEEREKEREKFGESEKGETVIINLSVLDWTNPIKYLLIKEILDTIYTCALTNYKETGEANFNTLVVLDEAHRLAPPDKYINDTHPYIRKVKNSVIKSYVETRKFGVGWIAISTRLSLLDTKIFEHARVKIVGYGLHTGSDRDLLREHFGPEFIELYSRVNDPYDPLSPERTHVFVFHGPICLLSGGAPEVVKMFNDTNVFFQQNFS